MQVGGSKTLRAPSRLLTTLVRRHAASGERHFCVGNFEVRRRSGFGSLFRATHPHRLQAFASRDGRLQMVRMSHRTSKSKHSAISSNFSDIFALFNQHLAKSICFKTNVLRERKLFL